MSFSMYLSAGSVVGNFKFEILKRVSYSQKAPSMNAPLYLQENVQKK